MLLSAFLGLKYIIDFHANRKRQKIIAIWISMISGKPTINLKCRVLCLIRSIVIYIAAEPPIRASRNSVASGTRRL